MTVLFIHDEFFPDDERGFGLWRTEHHYEHVQMNLLARGLDPPYSVPEFDILSWDESDKRNQHNWLVGHYEMHLVLREVTGISGIDLAEVDWEDPLSQSVWLLNHASEHETLRQVFGIEA